MLAATAAVAAGARQSHRTVWLIKSFVLAVTDDVESFGVVFTCLSIFGGFGRFLHVRDRSWSFVADLVLKRSIFNESDYFSDLCEAGGCLDAKGLGGC